MMAPKKGLAVKKNPWYNFMTQVAPDGSWNISKRWVSGYLQIDGIQGVRKKKTPYTGLFYFHKVSWTPPPPLGFQKRK